MQVEINIPDDVVAKVKKHSKKKARYATLCIKHWLQYNLSELVDDLFFSINQSQKNNPTGGLLTEAI